jgi:hypothetical protein
VAALFEGLDTVGGDHSLIGRFIKLRDVTPFMEAAIALPEPVRAELFRLATVYAAEDKAAS